MWVAKENILSLGKYMVQRDHDVPICLLTGKVRMPRKGEETVRVESSFSIPRGETSLLFDLLACLWSELALLGVLIALVVLVYPLLVVRLGLEVQVAEEQCEKHHVAHV